MKWNVKNRLNMKMKIILYKKIITEEIEEIVEVEKSKCILGVKHKGKKSQKEKEQKKFIKIKKIKEQYVPYKCFDNLFNFEENEITKILTEAWKCDLDKHHSIAYIVNNNYYYKIPKNTINQYIKFDFIIFNGIVYYKCLTNPEITANYEHYTYSCCGMVGHHKLEICDKEEDIKNIMNLII